MAAKDRPIRTGNAQIHFRKAFKEARKEIAFTASFGPAAVLELGPTMANAGTRLKQEIGGRVPEIALPGLDGSACSLSSFLECKRGAAVIFWAEACSHCMRYDGYLNRIESRFPEIALIAVASRQGESIEQIKAAVDKRNLRFPILHDSTGRVARLWFTQQTPRVFLVNSARRLLYRGAIDNFKYPEDAEYRAYLDPAIEAFLAGKPIVRPETASFGCAIQSVYYILPRPLS